jgi:hypothetical protein
VIAPPALGRPSSSNQGGQEQAGRPGQAGQAVRRAGHRHGQQAPDFDRATTTIPLLVLAAWALGGLAVGLLGHVRLRRRVRAIGKADPSRGSTPSWRAAMPS